MASKPPEEKTVLHGETSWVGSQAYGDWWEKHSAGGPSVMEADKRVRRERPASLPRSRYEGVKGKRERISVRELRRRV